MRKKQGCVSSKTNRNQRKFWSRVCTTRVFIDNIYGTTIEQFA